MTTMKQAAATTRVFAAVCAFCVLTGLPCRGGAPEPWVLTNPLGCEYKDEPVRLKLDLHPSSMDTDLVVTANGKEVPFQIEERNGQTALWSLATVTLPDAAFRELLDRYGLAQPSTQRIAELEEKRQRKEANREERSELKKLDRCLRTIRELRAEWLRSRTIEYKAAEGKPSVFKPKVRVVRQEDGITMDNGLLAVRVPVKSAGGIPGPVSGVRLPDGAWVGKSTWNTDRALRRFSAEITGAGTVFGKVKLRYEFEGRAGLYGKTPAFAEIELALYPGQNHVVIEESHEMERGAFWRFECSEGWNAGSCLARPHGDWERPPGIAPWPPVTLGIAHPRLASDTMIRLLPRWNQCVADGWLFLLHDGRRAVGAVPTHPSRWMWPHDNRIHVQVKPGTTYAGLCCPVRRGARAWFLLAGSLDRWRDKAAKAYVMRHYLQQLDKLHHDYILDWPEWEAEAAKQWEARLEQDPELAARIKDDPVLALRSKPSAGRFSGVDYYSRLVNPTDGWRGYGRSSILRAGELGDIGTLTKAQVILDPDGYGTYWNFFSPENPNFFTEFVQPGIALTCQLRAHPRFKELARRAELKLREDLYHSVALPGGAGQECPGYLSYAMGKWKALAPLCKQYLGFDPAQWPRFKAGASFLLHVSQPIGNGERRCHPGGDTHPLGPDVFAKAAAFDVLEDPKSFKTEELPGFGVVFRNRPGTEQETYLAFKSGPNRGHYHGDQLSYHYCARARPVAIDHMCSYAPKAVQEHMHNRVAFHTEELPYANMGGFERLIAFKRSDTVDVAIGQVESERLRPVRPLPPSAWDWEYPNVFLDKTLKYRRTIVAVKGAEADYFVIRDQHSGPRLNATYCLHVVSEQCEREGATVRFGNVTLFCAAPRLFDYSRYDWGFEKKRKKTVHYSEQTKGIRLTTAGAETEFITVLYPGDRPPETRPIANGVAVGRDEIRFTGAITDDDGATYVTVNRNGKRLIELTGRDIDMNRSQGEIGLCVPGAGYAFGEIPDWLIKQRIGRPEWAGR